MLVHEKIYIPQRLSKEHVPEIVRLEKACFSMPWSLEQCTHAFTQKNFAAFGIVQNYETSQNDLQPSPLIAYVSFYHALDELEILNIAVEPAFRKRQLASFLLSTTLQAARKMAIKRAVLEVRTTNTAALRLYTRLHFVCVGKRPKYYKDTGEDALIYALNL